MPGRSDSETANRPGGRRRLVQETCYGEMCIVFGPKWTIVEKYGCAFLRWKDANDLNYLLDDSETGDLRGQTLEAELILVIT